MALSLNEAIFVKAMILHGNKESALKQAFPRLQKGFEKAAIRHMMQNPEIQRHINAGILYVYRDIAGKANVAEPQPLTIEDKMELLRMVIAGERETPKYIVTAQGLKMIFAEPSEQEVREAKIMLKELRLAEKLSWVY